MNSHRHHCLASNPCRHWTELSSIVGTSLPLPSTGLTLSHLLQASLTKHQEEVEELCAGVTKEEAVEKKLKGVAVQWQAEGLTFAEHKQRGLVVLKVLYWIVIIVIGCSKRIFFFVVV